MRLSLTKKLTLAFLVVGLTGVLSVALFVQQRTHDEFDQFVTDKNQNIFLSDLTQYYQLNGNWNGIEKITGHNRHPVFKRDSSPFSSRLGTLIDANGIVLLSNRHDQVGRPIDKNKLEQSIPLLLDEQVIGYFIFDDRGWNTQARAPEEDFLQNINQAILRSALLATAIALVLAILLARTLARPIKELTVATKAVSGGKLGYQVKIRSKDELGDLTTSFNQMSADLAQSSKQRRQMTADIAHDLRTPLSVLLGYTEALSDGKLHGTSEIFKVMHNETKHLNCLVDDLRTLSLADAGELTLVQQPCKPNQLLTRTAATYRGQADKNGIALVVETPQNLPTINVDPERIAQVLGNLVSNALRHTPTGGKITLSAWVDNAKVYLTVQDTGSGIPPKDLPYIFNRFYRAQKSRAQQQGESGLGLTIAKSLVEAHGGSISVTSPPGHGTTFTIILPDIL